MPVLSSDPELDAALDTVAPGLDKWAVVVVVEPVPGGAPPVFRWHQYRQTGTAQNFWPASTIKIFPAIAALELLNEKCVDFDCVVAFSRPGPDGKFAPECARTVKEMLSEVFRRSSNEDYTLLLRMVGLDRINRDFLIPARGFDKSSLMRGYVLASARPWGYRREDPQRITIRDAAGRELVHDHKWGGKFYAEERGCTVIDAKTGNVTTPRDLAECLRRLFFHERIPEAERFRLTQAQVDFLRRGGDGLTGLQTTGPDSYPIAWTNGVEKVFPRATFFHKCGLISDFGLEAAFVDDSRDSGKQFILVPVVHAGLDGKPPAGPVHIAEMARRIAEWVRGR
ncbi:MAG: serine hydrolase [Verrucomicrobiales bacterium]|nr:serine hydrolase [Verrucomicrobiales bacterium]